MAPDRPLVGDNTEPGSKVIASAFSKNFPSTSFYLATDCGQGTDELRMEKLISFDVLVLQSGDFLLTA